MRKVTTFENCIHIPSYREGSRNLERGQNITFIWGGSGECVGGSIIPLPLGVLGLSDNQFLHFNTSIAIITALSWDKRSLSLCSIKDAFIQLQFTVRPSLQIKHKSRLFKYLIIFGRKFRGKFKETRPGAIRLKSGIIVSL